MAGTSYKLIDNSDLILNATDEAIQTALEAIGQNLETYAKDICPVDTGRLRNSITHAVSGNRGKRDYQADDPPEAFHDGEARGDPPKGVVYVGTNVEYAPVIELGGKGRTPRPFLKPAVENNMDDFTDILKKALKNA